MLLGSAATATDVCTEFLTEHPGDPSWEQKCLDWLEQQQQQQPFGNSASGSGSAMAVSGPVADAPVHVSASDPDLDDGNQNEAFLAIDPTNPQRIFYTSRTEPFPFSNGLLAARSTNGGASWTPVKIAVGPGGPIPAGSADPWAVWSDTGKLFFSYLADLTIDESGPPFEIPAGARPTVVAKSSDGGSSFEFVEALPDPTTDTDRGSIATGAPGAFPAHRSLWVIYEDRSTSTIKVSGAALDSAGDPMQGTCGEFFCNEQTIALPGGELVAPGHIAVGPDGQVLATFFRFGDVNDPMDVFAALDPDGLGSEPFAPVPPGGGPILQTGVTFVHRVPPHEERGVRPLANLAWDQTTGRVYLASTVDSGNFDTDIVLLHSDNNGIDWSDPWQVNQDDTGSQFFPHVAEDQTTGTVAVAWHDPRNSATNTETEVFAAISADGKFFHESP